MFRSVTAAAAVLALVGLALPASAADAVKASSAPTAGHATKTIQNAQSPAISTKPGDLKTGAAETDAKAKTTTGATTGAAQGAAQGAIAKPVQNAQTPGLATPAKPGDVKAKTIEPDTKAKTPAAGAVAPSTGSVIPSTGAVTPTK